MNTPIIPNKPIRAVLTITAFIFGVASAITGAEPAVTKLADLPPAAQKAIQAQLGAAKLEGISKSVDAGEVTYDVEITAHGKTRSFSIDQEGELLATQVFLNETPVAVQKAIRAHVGRGKIDDISKASEDGVVTYQVEMTKAGKSRSFTLAEDGKLLEMQLFLAETPAHVRQAIQKEARNGVCAGIYKTVEDGEVNYDVEITRNGKLLSLTFDSKGAVVYQAEPIQISDAPEPVRATLRAQLSNAKLVTVEKTVEDGELTYEAEFIKAGKRQSLSIKPDGQILPPDKE